MDSNARWRRNRHLMPQEQPEWAFVFWPHNRAPEDVPVMEVPRDCLAEARAHGFVVLADEGDIVDAAAVVIQSNPRRVTDDEDAA